MDPRQDWRDQEDVKYADLERIKRHLCTRCGRVVESLERPAGWVRTQEGWMCPGCNISPWLNLLMRQDGGET
jgi:hypothetical protein